MVGDVDRVGEKMEGGWRAWRASYKVDLVRIQILEKRMGRSTRIGRLPRETPGVGGTFPDSGTRFRGSGRPTRSAAAKGRCA